MSWLTDLATTISSGLVKGIILLIDALIPVMLYNSFSTAPVVQAGWAIVRDTVNMFFVIILIIIAFGTIFGHKKFQWQQQVPRLLIFAIVINFSKTLAGIMIDFGQVIMLTFANALREIAAGNFIELFGLNEVYKLTESNPGNPTGNFDLFLTSLASVGVLLWVITILLMMFAILIYRVVALWILIVLAPLAWFAGGAQDLLSSNAYADWWKQFKCLVAIGPVITFFLWLALAVAAGSGTDGFDTGTGGASNSGFLTQIFELQSFLSLVIGSAILLAGMQQAQSLCSVMGNMNPLSIGKGALQLGKGVSMKAGGWAARKGLSGARSVARTGVRYGAHAIKDRPVLGAFTRPRREKFYRKMAAGAGSGIAGRVVGRFVEKRADKLSGLRAEQIAKAGMKYKDDSASVKVNRLKRLATDKAITLGGQDETKALMKEMMGNKDLREKFEKEGGDVGALWKNYGADMEKDFAGDDGTTANIKKFKKRHAHLTGSVDELKDKDDLDNLSLAAMGDSAVQEKMRTMTIDAKKGKDGKVVEMTGMAAAAEGYLGIDKQKIARGQVADMDAQVLSQMNTETVLANASVSQIESVANLSLEQQNIPQVQQIVQGLINKQDDPKTSPKDHDDITRAITSLFDKLSQKIELKDGSSRFLAKAQTLQSMIKNAFPVVSTPEDVKKREEIRIEISLKEAKLGTVQDLNVRSTIQDEIVVLKQQLGSLGGSMPNQDNSESQTPPAHA